MVIRNCLEKNIYAYERMTFYFRFGPQGLRGLTEPELTRAVILNLFIHVSGS